MDHKQLADKSTRQEIFNAAYERIVEQGVQCVDDNDACVYNDGNGNHCAIGILVSKKLAEQFDELSISEGYNMTASSIAYRGENAGLKLPLWLSKDNAIFLRDVQSAHDIWGKKKEDFTTFLESFKYHMNEVAEKYKLEGIT